MSEPVRLWRAHDDNAAIYDLSVFTSRIAEPDDVAYLALPAPEYDALVRERDAFVRLFDPEGMNVVTAMVKARAALENRS